MPPILVGAPHTNVFDDHDQFRGPFEARLNAFTSRCIMVALSMQRCHPTGDAEGWATADMERSAVLLSNSASWRVATGFADVNRVRLL